MEDEVCVDQGNYDFNEVETSCKPVLWCEVEVWIINIIFKCA